MYTVESFENIRKDYMTLENRLEYILSLRLNGYIFDLRGFYYDNEKSCICVTYYIPNAGYYEWHWDEEVPFEWLNMPDDFLKEAIETEKELKRRLEEKKKLKKEEEKRRIIEEREREEYERLKEKYG